MNVEYKDKTYNIKQLYKDAKIYLDCQCNNSGVAIIYYDDITKTVKKKKYNFNNFGMNIATTKAVMFLKELNNLKREIYIKIVNVYNKKIMEEMMSVLKPNSKAKNTFKLN